MRVDWFFDYEPESLDMAFSDYCPNVVIEDKLKSTILCFRDLEA